MKLHFKQKKIVLCIIVIVTLGQFGIDLYLASLPYIANYMQSSIATIKLTIPLYLLTYSLSQLLYGPLSDTLGRKPTLCFGLTIFLIGSLGCALAQTSLILILFRTLQGVGIGSTMVNARALIRDHFHGKQMTKVASWVAIVWAFTPVIAPMIGGYIQTYLGWQASFGVMFLYAVLILLLILLLLPATTRKKGAHKFHPSFFLKKYQKIFKDKIFFSFALMTALVYSHFISFLAASPFLLQIGLGLTPIQYGWAILIIACGISLGAKICSHLVVQIKLTNLLVIASSWMLISTFFMLFLAWSGFFNLFSLMIPQFFSSMGAGMIFPCAIAGAMTHYKSDAGIAGASFGSIQMFSSFIFTVIVSHLHNHTPFPLAIELFIITVLTFMISFFYIKPNFQEETKVEKEL